MRLALCVITHGSGAFCCARSRLTVSTKANRRDRSSTECLVALFPVPSGLQAGEDWERDAKQQKATTVNGAHPRRCALPTLRARQPARLLSLSKRPAERAVGDRLSVRCCSGTPPSGGNPQSRSRAPLRGADRPLRHATFARNAGLAHGGLAQENGAIESPHGHLKRALAGPITASSTRWWGDEARPEPSADPSLLAERLQGSW